MAEHEGRRPTTAASIVAAGAILATVLVAGFTASPAAATEISVATEAEYRQALTDLSSDASGPHTIRIQAPLLITAGGGDPVYTGDQPLTIEGGDELVQAVAGVRFLDHQSAAALTLEALSLEGFGGPGPGAAVRSAAESTTVTGSTFRANTSTGSGGAISFTGSLQVRQSTFVDNAGQVAGGALHGTATSGTLVIEASTFHTNVSLGAGAAVHTAGSVEALNSTFAGNDGTSVIQTTGQGPTGAVELWYVTMLDSQLSGPGAAAVSTGAAAGLDSFGTVIAQSTGGAACDVASTSSAYSYSSDATCAFVGTGDVQDGPAPGLGPLADNGGPTRTMAIVGQDTPLYDVIPSGDCSAGPSTVDQRGRPRPGDLSEGCDIGAFELQRADLPPDEPPSGPTPQPTPSGADGGPVRAAPGFTG